MIVISLLSSLNVNSGNLYYYGEDEQIPLSFVLNKRALLRQPSLEREDYIERMGSSKGPKGRDVLIQDLDQLEQLLAELGVN